MQIICSSLLEFRKYEDKQIICQVKLAPNKDLAYGDDTVQRPQDLHWLDTVDWRSFEAALQRIAADQLSEFEQHLDEVFDFGATGRLHVTQLSTPVETLLDFLGHKRLDADEQIWALECAIELKKNAGAVPKLNISSKKNENAEIDIVSSQENVSQQEQTESSLVESADSSSIMYVPSPIKSQTTDLYERTDTETPLKKRYSPRTSSNVKQPPYTPSPIKRQTHSADSSNEDRYSPTVSVEADQPKYEPSPIRKHAHSADSKNEDRYSPIFSGEVDQPTYKASPIKVRTRADKKKEENIFSDSSEDDLKDKYSRAVTRAKRVKEHKARNEANVPKEGGITVDKKKIIKSPNKSPESISSKLSDKVKQGKNEHQQRSKSKESVVEDLDHRYKKSTLGKVYENEKNKERKLDGDSKRSSRQKLRSELELTPTAETTKRAVTSSADEMSPFRRSARSPVKPKRLINEIGEQKISKFTTHKKKLSTRELFGSGDENDDFDEITPVKNAPRTEACHQASTTKKRKRSEKADCTQEKLTINKWLSKNPVESTDGIVRPLKTQKHLKDRSSRAKPLNIETHSKERKSKSEHSIKVIPTVYPTKEEIDRIKEVEKERMETNKRMKEMLEDYLEAQKPKKVEILSLNFMSSEEILSTFGKYSHNLDHIFKLYRKRPNINHYNGINHYTVINLIESDKELQMMLKLGEVYETDTEGTSLYTKLFANAMMPEWLVNIFKDKYKLTYDEAVTQIKAQADYKEYIDSLQDD